MCVCFFLFFSFLFNLLCVWRKIPDRAMRTVLTRKLTLKNARGNGKEQEREEIPQASQEWLSIFKSRWQGETLAHARVLISPGKTDPVSQRGKKVLTGTKKLYTFSSASTGHEKNVAEPKADK